MTAGRPQRKRIRLGSLAAGLLLCAVLTVPGAAATTQQIVNNWHTGLAINGIDPVAYFVDQAPKHGREDIELRLGGVTWLFRNEGNRAAFASDPDVYMPRFGGYDPVALTRGVAVAGHPDFWVIDKDRLYLFYTAEARDAFRADPEYMSKTAEEKWREIRRALVQ